MMLCSRNSKDAVLLYSDDESTTEVAQSPLEAPVQTSFITKNNVSTVSSPLRVEVKALEKAVNEML